MLMQNSAQAPQETAEKCAGRGEVQEEKPEEEIWRRCTGITTYSESKVILCGRTVADYVYVNDEGRTLKYTPSCQILQCNDMSD